MREIKEKLISTRKKLQEFGKNFPNIDDVTGAYKGLVQLQMTYKIDPYHLVHNYFKFGGKTYYGSGNRSQITVEDLGNCAYHTFTMNYYDVVANFLKAIYKVEDQNPGRIKDIKPVIDGMKKDVITANNQKLIKYRKRAGEGFRSK